MSANTVYQLVQAQLQACLDPSVSETTRQRLSLLVTGMIRAKHAAPAQIARALAVLGLTEAHAESIERRIRRIENDPTLTDALCFHPFVRHHLALGKPAQLRLILDPSCQDERVVLVSLSVWYRGRALPLCWAAWEGNCKLEGERFWERIEALLQTVASLLPRQTPVILLADRAFGTPVFLDLLEARGWGYVVRVQDQTRCRDHLGQECCVRSLVARRGQRLKRVCAVFKKAGWRTLSLVVYWGQRHPHPLCLVSNLPVGWHLIDLYRCRYPIEAGFKEYKSSGWRWEQGQVVDLEHTKRLLVGMALASWLAVLAGAEVARHLLSERATGQRKSLCWWGKRSLFQLGLDQLHALLYQHRPLPRDWRLDAWEAGNWQRQVYAHHVRPFIFCARLSLRAPSAVRSLGFSKPS